MGVDDKSAGGAAAGRKPFWRSGWGVLLAVSLALNAFVAANVVGAGLRGHGPLAWALSERDHSPGRRGGGRLFRQLIQEYPDLRPLARELRAARREAFRAFSAESAAASSAFVSALRADPFDAAALQAAEARRQALRTRRRDAMDEAVGAFVAAMTPTQRRRFAELWEARADRRRRRVSGGD